MKWVFGDGVSLDFKTSPPTYTQIYYPFNKPKFNSFEACSTIADENGDLLFYTDGRFVWNKNHEVMENGDSLDSDQSSTQGTLIVKKPGSKALYYIFTTPGNINKKHLYHIIDLCANNGLGKVIAKQIPFSTTISSTIAPSERLCAVRHCNTNDVWIITHSDTGTVFRSYLLSSAGLNTVGIVSNVGTASSVVGCLKASPNGKKLALANYQSIIPFELFDFDNSTGIVSNGIPLQTDSIQNGYGVEFSADGTKLYGSAYVLYYITQWDLCAGNAAAIAASRKTISTSLSSKNQLYRAADGKIYMPHAWDSYLGVINNPNATGVLCNYQDSGMSVAPGICSRGLQNIVSSFIPQNFTYSVSPGACNLFTFMPPPLLTSVQNCTASNSFYTGNLLWNFGDPVSGAANTSTVVNATHAFASAGEHLVTLILYTECGADTVRQLLSTLPSFSTNEDLTGCFRNFVCSGETLTLSAYGTNSFTWNTGQIQSQIIVTPTINSFYTVAASNSLGCTTTKKFSIYVTSCVGVDEITLDADKFLQLFPNPATDKLTVNCKVKMELQIISLLGKVMASYNLPSGESSIDISSLKAGLYLLKATAEETTFSSRLLKTD